MKTLPEKSPVKYAILVCASLFYLLKCDKILNNLLQVGQTCCQVLLTSWQVLQNELDIGTHEVSLKFQYEEIFSLLIMNAKICLGVFPRKQVDLTSPLFVFNWNFAYPSEKFKSWYGRSSVQRKFNLYIKHIVS